MSIILQRPWTRQPRTRTGLNRASSLSSGIVYAANFANWSQPDEIYQARFDLSADFAGTLQSRAAGDNIGLYFDGSTNVAVERKFSSIATLQSDLTMMAVVRSTVAGTFGTWPTVMQIGEINDNNWGHSLSINTDNLLAYGTGSGTSANDTTVSTNVSTFNVEINKTSAIAIAVNGTTRELTFGYDGQVGTNTGSTRTGSTASGFGLGASWVSGNAQAAGRFSGTVFMAAVWNRTLSAVEVAEVTRRPWQLFAPLPRRIWVPSAGGAGNTYNVDLTDSASATDSSSGAAVYAAAASEAASASDAASYVIVAVAAASESASSTDAAASTLSTSDAASEAASATDTVAAGAASYSVDITEAASATDAVSAIATLVASMSETLAAADAVTVSLVMAADAAESASATDATNWGGAIYSVAAEESATLSDAVSSALEALAAMHESAGAGETFAAILSAGAELIDAATAGDIVAAAWQTTALLTETATATDTVAESAGGVLTAAMNEAASAGDVVTVQFIAGFVAITVAPRRRVRGGATSTTSAGNLNTGGRLFNRPGRGR